VDRAHLLIEKYFAVSEGELRVDGVSVADIARQFGTPLFLYDSSVLDRKWVSLRQTFPEAFEIYYSVKANPNRTIIRHFLHKGAGLEIASSGEFHQAIQAGCEPGRILFAGPGKTEAELEFVLKAGIGEIHVESPVEADRISAISRRFGIKARVSLRINPSAEAQGGAMRMGGKPAAFGVDEEQSDELIDRLTSDACMDFQGIHLFAGTQVLDDAVLAAQYNKGVDLAKHIATRIGRPLHTVDFGGGLGIPYFLKDHELNVTSLAQRLVGLMERVKGDPSFSGTRFVVEPGRYLVGESGIYVTRIIDVKVSRGKTFVIVDGGMQHHLAASGNLGQTIKRNYPIALVNRVEDSRTVTADLVGPLCTPLDTLGRDVEMPPPRMGDLVGIFQSGAYGLTASPMAFLSHPIPAEVFVHAGKPCLIRARGSYSDLPPDPSTSRSSGARPL
jgi:diaminopimelate decarboxylase